ncbi:unnamed protein product [Paramecium sonneborni]|uniref:Uncharacterized protein n=1 Tax=Paramecium sonneborni TaxID=65129 RepID=A0A8S1LHL6_9CILI|nr:unnamed protein product [Paramecium sonneborni]
MQRKNFRDFKESQLNHFKKQLITQSIKIHIIIISYQNQTITLLVDCFSKIQY